MKVDTGHCTACDAKNSKFVEKCYKCGAVLPWGAGYVTPQKPAPAAPQPPPPNPAPRPQAVMPFSPAPQPLPPAPSYQPAPAYQSQPQFQPMPVDPDAYPQPYPQNYPPQNYPQYPQTPMPHPPIGAMICPSCGYSGGTRSYSQGSTTIGILLCLLWLLPGIVYFIWQASTNYEGCPQCRGRAMVSTQSPQGQYLLRQFYGL